MKGRGDKLTVERIKMLILYANEVISRYADKRGDSGPMTVTETGKSRGGAENFNSALNLFCFFLIYVFDLTIKNKI